jgi:hypothetical protein
MYAFMIGGKRIKKMAKENVERVNKNDFSMMMVYFFKTNIFI